MAGKPGLKPLRQGFGVTIQSQLILLVLVLLLPTLLIQANIYSNHLETRLAREFQSYLEIARSTSHTFEDYISLELQREMELGHALSRADSLTTDDRNRILLDYQAKQSIVWDYAWASPEGMIVAASNSGSIGHDAGDRESFRQIIAGRDWSVSNLIIDKATGEAVFTINRAIRGPQGNLLGIVLASIEPHRLEQLLKADKSESTVISIVDSRGMLIYRYPRSITSWEERNWGKIHPYIRNAIEGEEIVWAGKSAREDKLRISANAPIASIGWTAGAGRIEEMTIGTVKTSLIPRALPILIATLLVFGVALIFSRRISASIRHLRDHALALGRGEAAVPPIASGPREIRELAAAHGIMAEKILSRETALRQSEARFRSFFELSMDGIFAVDRTGRFLMANPASIRLSGYTEEELRNLTYLDICATECREAALASFNRSIFDGIPSEIELVMVCKDGHRVDLLVAGSPMLVSGTVEGIFCVSRNITEKKEAEQALHQSEERFRLFFENSMDGILASIPDEDSIVAANQSACRIFRCTEEQLCAIPASDLVDPADPRVAAMLNELNNSGKWSGELTYSRKDGTRFPAEISSALFRDSLGRKLSIVILRDVTDRKRTEEDLRRARDEFELRVKERTADLKKANEQLRSFPAKLIAVQEEERKRLAAELHDSIGQTLAALKFWVEMAVKMNDDGHPDECIDHLQRFVPMLQHSIEETRNIYMGLRPTILDSLGLLATLDWLTREFMKLYPRMFIELERSVKEEEVPDSLKICVFRIVQEALNNTAKHSRAEWIDLSFTKDERGITLSIADDGVGMDLDYILLTSTARSLGLTSMRERAELTGGSITIESAPNQGTTIRAFWPSEVLATSAPDRESVESVQS